MLEKFHLLRNIGQFDSVSPPASATLSPFSLIYAENGRGKTTLSTVLGSLATGDATLLSDRQRLGALHPPHIVISYSGQQVIFQNGTWSQTVPNIAIFDDVFVADNVCSGIDLKTSHKQNLHELILGAQGVALSKSLQTYVARIEQHNAELREKGDAIPAVARGPLTANAFCSLKADDKVDTKLREAERRLAAAKASDTIRKQAEFTSISLPNFNEQALREVLGQSLPNLEADAATRAREHFRNLGSGGETWVSDGMQRIEGASTDKSNEVCPFCEQDLAGSNLIDHYRAFFSEAYTHLKEQILSTGIGVRDTHGGDIPAAFERSIRTAVQKQEFWKKFTGVPEVSIDTAAVSRDWKVAREAVLQQLRAKATAPLEPMLLAQETVDAIRVYRIRIEEARQLSDSLIDVNKELEVVKEQAAADDLGALTADIEKLKAKKARYEPNIAPFYDVYIAEKDSKKETEKNAIRRVKNWTSIEIIFFLNTKQRSMNTSKNSMLLFA